MRGTYFCTQATWEYLCHTSDNVFQSKQSISYITSQTICCVATVGLMLIRLNRILRLCLGLWRCCYNMMSRTMKQDRQSMLCVCVERHRTKWSLINIKTLSYIRTNSGHLTSYSDNYILAFTGTHTHSYKALQWIWIIIIFSITHLPNMVGWSWNVFVCQLLARNVTSNIILFWEQKLITLSSYKSQTLSCNTHWFELLFGDV